MLCGIIRIFFAFSISIVIASVCCDSLKNYNLPLNLKYSYKTFSLVGPSYWYGIAEACGGENQSPININTENIKKIRCNPLKITNFHDHPEKNICLKRSISY